MPVQGMYVKVNWSTKAKKAHKYSFIKYVNIACDPFFGVQHFFLHPEKICNSWKSVFNDKVSYTISLALSINPVPSTTRNRLDK